MQGSHPCWTTSKQAESAHLHERVALVKMPLMLTMATATDALAKSRHIPSKPPIGYGATLPQ